jgi:hypothetical protein
MGVECMDFSKQYVLVHKNGEYVTDGSDSRRPKVFSSDHAAAGFVNAHLKDPGDYTIVPLSEHPDILAKLDRV